MIKIQIVSDLHFEFMKPAERHALVESLSDTDVDVLVAAGDLGNAATFVEALRSLAPYFKHVVFVAGNHEFYGSDRSSVLRMRDQLPTNVHWLEEETLELYGVTFAGCTSWFRRHSDPSHQHTWSDYNWIRHGWDWIPNIHDSSTRFLQQLSDVDVVVTHHAPSSRSIRPKWQGSGINGYFANDFDATVATSGAQLWIHGHMHDPSDYHIGSTRVICNPKGYPNERQETSFNPRLVVDVKSQHG